MDTTLLRALFFLVLVGLLLVWSLISFLKKRAAFALIQLLGAGFLAIVVLTHVFEALSLFPSMQWGSPHSAGHYLDLVSAILGLILFPTGLLLRLQKNLR
jgi:hypothetical protein